MSVYPPFSGDAVECIKCGGRGAGTTYVATPCMDLGDGHTVLLGGPDEHLCRTCSRCGYTWDEATVGD